MKNLKFLNLLLITISIMFLFFNSCVTAPADSWTDGEPLQNDKPSPIQKKLIESAEHFRGATTGSLKADDRSYTLDCTGALMAIYYRAGIDLEKCYTGYEGNGVKRLYSSLRDNNLILSTGAAQPGDLLFWDNTYDRNEDGKFNDYFTHAGMVVSVDKKGTITYVHHNYRKGLIYEKMNLKYPDNTKLNSAMRMRGSPPAPNGQYLSSHIIRVIGRAWQLPKSYWR
jgi:hypothetical protein